MKRSRLFAIVALSFCVFLSSCGQTYHLQSILITPNTAAIESLNGYASFTVTAALSNGQTRDVTGKSSFSLTPPSDISIGGQNFLASQMQVRQGTTNQIQAIGEVCTWTWILNSDSTYTYRQDSFLVTVSFENQTAQAPLSVNSSISNDCFDPSKPAPPGTPSGSGLPL